MTVNIEPIKFSVGDDSYKYQPLGAKKARHVFDRIAREVLAPVLGEMQGEGAGSAAHMAKAIGAALRTMSPDLHDNLVDTFAAQTMVVHSDGREQHLAPMIDTFFALRYGAELEWLITTVRRQYADFFERMGRELSNAPQQPAPTANG